MSNIKDKQKDYGLTKENPARPTTDLAVLVCAMQNPTLLEECMEEALTFHKYEVDGKDCLGMTALHWAVCYERVQAIKLLIGKGARIDSSDKFGGTPLFYATGRAPNAEIAQYLIENGATVDYRNTNGAIPLHGAALQGNTECVKLLLKHGADPKAMDHDGKTPLDLCDAEETKKVIYKANKKADKAKEKSDAHCAWCGEGHDDLKKCARCHSVMYCGRDCQVRHWKEGGHKNDCKGHILAYPVMPQVPGQDVCGVTFSNVFGAMRPTVDVRIQPPTAESKPKSGFLKNTRFVVKVQVPLDGVDGHCGNDGIGIGKGDMMVYNEDRTVFVFIKASEPEYGSIRKKITNEGFMRVKAYFWAELCNDDTGAVKIYHGKTAPFQQW
ncbi:uncharacterized protein LOC144433265 [Glandiceps talaboti]